LPSDGLSPIIGCPSVKLDPTPWFISDSLV
jgi:hypothetical protein